MTDAESVRWDETPTEDEYRRRMAAFVGKALSVGLVAGAGAFAYNMPQFVSLGVGDRLLLVPVLAGGVFSHLFAPTLRRSIRLCLAGFFVGLTGLVAAWTAPLVALPYSPGAVDVLLPKLMREAITVAFINFSPTYLGGYLLAVSVAAFWE